MTSTRKLLFGFVSALLIMLAVVIYLPAGKKRWLRYTGAVIPNGSSTYRYTNRPVTILSVTGERWAPGDKLEPASAYHALVIFPIVMPEEYDGLSGGDGLTHTDTHKWRVPKGQRPDDLTEERQVALSYDAVWQTITFDSRSYHLSNGNLFVIRYDQKWQPTVTQLNATMNKPGPEEEINAFKSALKFDNIVQQL